MKLYCFKKFRMENLISQFETFSSRHDIDNPEIIVTKNEIVITSEVLNFDFGTALITSITCLGLIFISENGFGFLLFGLALVFCYIMWNKLQYVNTSSIDYRKKEISIKRKLIKNERRISFSTIDRFHVKHIETSPRYRNFKVNIMTVNNGEIKLIDFSNEEAARDFARLMNLLAKKLKNKN